MLLDTSVDRTLRKEDLHETDYSPWEGWRVRCWPETTVLRGKVVVENGQLLGSPSDGQWLPRKVDPGILAGPAL